MSCGEGRVAINENSSQPCGCDLGAKWPCERHRTEARLVRLNTELQALVTDWRTGSEHHQWCAAQLQAALDA